MYERKKEVALIKTITSLCNEFAVRAVGFVFNDTSHVYTFGYEYQLHDQWLKKVSVAEAMTL